MENKDNSNLVVVFSGVLGQATMIQNMLEKNQIQAFVENRLMGSIEPWVISAGGFNVFVSNLNYDLSMKLIEQFIDSETIDQTE